MDEKGLTDMDHSAVIAGASGVRRINGNGKNTKKKHANERGISITNPFIHHEI